MLNKQYFLVFLYCYEEVQIPNNSYSYPNFIAIEL
jgi:hypothetical protein